MKAHIRLPRHKASLNKTRQIILAQHPDWKLRDAKHAGDKWHFVVLHAKRG